MNSNQLIALAFVPAIFAGFLHASVAFAVGCKSMDIIPIVIPDTVCALGCPAGYAEALPGPTCDVGFCCVKLPPAPTTVSPLLPAPSTGSPSIPKVGTKFLCEFNQGHCVSAPGCNGKAPLFESEIGTCEDGARCCKKDPTLVPAAKKDVGSPWTISNPLGANADFPTIIGRVIATFLGMVGAISLVVFVYAGVRYLTAGGNEQSVTTAKDTMKYAFFGLVIILFAYVITNFFFEALVKNAAPATPTKNIALPTLPKP